MKYKVYELQHHGVLGMKWGVRRYQNEDGSLTPAGEKRYNSNQKNVSKLVEKDAKRYADAKMFYGKTAGTRRKLLNAELNKKKKNVPGYEEEFNKAIEVVDYAKSAKKAVRKRHTIDAAYRTRVTVKQILGITGGLTATAAAFVYHKNKAQIDNFVIRFAHQIISSLRS